jgi:hypothetical protein
LRIYSNLSSPTSSGIGPSKLLHEKSRELKIVRIFSSFASSPFMVTDITS